MMNVERTISARRVEVKAAAPSPASSAPAPRTAVTLHERFSQLPKVEPKKEERRAPTVVDLNLFQEVGATTRRQATEQRQGTKREAVVAARRSIATTWTPSFDDDRDDDSGPRFNVNGGGGRRGRQFEFDQPRETAFVIKGIPPPQPSRQRNVMTSVQQTTSRSGARSTSRGGRIVNAVPATRGGARQQQQAGNQRPVNVRGGRGGQGGVVRGGRGGAVAGNQRGQAGATRGGGRGGARGGRGGGATRGGKTDAKPKDKDALDAELDSYMLKAPSYTAKGYLDQQLEEYMCTRDQESSSSSSS